ncbi:MAG: hypothetical protein LBO81_00225 [Clostridiales Family XIII bacterium]|jgi:hypothetical protein|nr:hypothetical protein [Clostridiales Family XIII bacterium]
MKIGEPKRNCAGIAIFAKESGIISLKEAMAQGRFAVARPSRAVKGDCVD